MTYLNGALFADAVADLPRVHPDGELLRQVLQDVLDGHAALARRPLEHLVDGVAGFEAAEGRTLEGLVGVPVTLEFVF